MRDEETLYAMALTRMTGFNQQVALQLYRELGSALAVYGHRTDIGDIVHGCSVRVRESLKCWDEALKRAEAEMAFAARHQIRVLTLNDDDYPLRMRDCVDAPLVLYYKGNADLNCLHIINLVGTRRATAYGQDLVRSFITKLREMCPQVLVVSGLAYGIDICAHRQALAVGYETVGILAHGLDTIYPNSHRATAVEMVSHGGLLTEHMSQTEPMPNNFRQRNRIVAGMSDATVVVESAYKGGALITARIAQDYGRDVFAFPGAVGAPYSEGCNNLIRDNKAGLIASAEDFVAAVGWPTCKETENARVATGDLFPALTHEEQTVTELLRQSGDLQLNILSVRANIPIGRLTSLLFELEMKGIVRPMAGGVYHLLMM